MTRTEMITTYNTLSAAHKYIVGFTQYGALWYVLTDDLMDEMLKLDHASSKRGGMAKIRVRLSSALRKALIASGAAVKLGGAELLDTDDRYNRGERFERIITEQLTGGCWVKDSVPFWVAGDITLHGEQVQVKLDGAELTNEKTLGALMGA